MPITFRCSRPETFHARCVITSMGFVTMISIVFGETLTTASVTFLMTSAFALRRSSLVIPGFRARPAVMTTMSEPEVAA